MAHSIKPGDSRIDRAFSIFYVGINVGAFFSPLIAGSLGENVGWHWGFFAAGVGMVIGLLIYLFALRTLPPDNLARRRICRPRPAKKQKAHKRRLEGCAGADRALRSGDLLLGDL